VKLGKNAKKKKNRRKKIAKGAAAPQIPTDASTLNRRKDWEACPGASRAPKEYLLENALSLLAVPSLPPLPFEGKAESLALFGKRGRKKSYAQEEG